MEEEEEDEAPGVEDEADAGTEEDGVAAAATAAACGMTRIGVLFLLLLQAVDDIQREEETDKSELMPRSIR